MFVAKSQEVDSAASFELTRSPFCTVEYEKSAKTKSLIVGN